MKMEKFALSIISCLMLVAFTGTALPSAGQLTELRHVTIKDDTVETRMDDRDETLTFGREDHGSGTSKGYEIVEKMPARAEITGTTYEGGEDLSSDITGKKNRKDPKPSTAKDREGGDTMGSSFDKESVAAPGKETARIRDPYMTAHKGMDISKFNGDIDWDKVVADGIEAVIIRVGGRYGASGLIYEDSRREENLKNAVKAGLAVGVYFYSQAITVEEGIEEAKFCIEAVKGYDLDLPIIIDYEWEPGYRLANAGTREERTEVVNAFCKTVTKAGYTGGIYASDYCFRDYLIAEKIYKNYYIWLAHWTSAELPGITYTGPFDGWQYSANGRVAGIDGPVDLDYFYWIDKFFVNYYVDDKLLEESTPITLGVRTKTKTAAELGIDSEDSSIFAGWHVFRERDNRWAAYKLTDETKKTVWVEPTRTGDLPEGYDYKIYPDGVKISDTAKGGNVNFYAAWTTDGYKIRYHNGKTTADVTTSVHFGVQTETASYESCGFSKKGYVFGGWKVRREYDGKWAVYANDDETRKTLWVARVNGELPEGYSYKMYRNKVSVSNSAPTGYVDFYAHWEKKES